MLNRYYAEKLGVTELAACRALTQAVSSRAKACNLGGIDPRRVGDIIHAALCERPDSYAWKSGIASLRRDGGAVWMNLSYIDCDSETVERTMREVFAEVSGALPPAATEYDKCLAVHEWLTANVTYEQELLEKYGTVRGVRESAEAFFGDPINAACFTAMGPLVNRRAVCQGIALAAAYLLRSMGVQVTCAKGSRDGVPHLWNVVEVEGERYILDCSSDVINPALPVKRYEHFLIPEEQFSKVYVLSESFGCTSRAQNYFVKNGAHFTSLREVRKFLGAYRFRGDGAVRFWYEGSVCDGKIRDTAVEVLGSRAGERLNLEHTLLVRDGMAVLKYSLK